jgi:hypothetical protein
MNKRLDEIRKELIDINLQTRTLSALTVEAEEKYHQTVMIIVDKQGSLSKDELHELQNSCNLQLSAIRSYRGNWDKLQMRLLRLDTEVKILEAGIINETSSHLY